MMYTNKKLGVKNTFFVKNVSFKIILIHFKHFDTTSLYFFELVPVTLRQSHKTFIKVV